MSSVFLIVFFTLTACEVIIYTASLLMGIKIKKLKGAEPAGRIGLGLILLSLSSLLYTLTDGQVINVFISNFLVKPRAISLGHILMYANYFRLIPGLLNIAGYYFIADYCAKKYGSRIRIPVLVIPVLKALIFRASVIIFHWESVLVKIPAANAVFNLVFDTAVLLLLAFTFLKNKEKEETFKALHIVFFILAGGKLLLNGLLAVSGDMPAIFVIFLDFLISPLYLVLPVYAFIKSRATE